MDGKTDRLRALERRARSILKPAEATFLLSAIQQYRRDKSLGTFLVAAGRVLLKPKQFTLLDYCRPLVSDRHLCAFDQEVFVWQETAVPPGASSFSGDAAFLNHKSDSNNGMGLVVITIKNKRNASLGFSIRAAGHLPKVSTVAPTSQAFKAGLRMGDMVLAINQHRTSGLPYSTTKTVLQDAAASGHKVKLIIRPLAVKPIVSRAPHSKESAHKAVRHKDTAPPKHQRKTGTTRDRRKDHSSTPQNTAQEYRTFANPVDGSVGIRMSGGRFPGDRVFVEHVSPGSSVYFAGIRPGMEVISANGIELASVDREYARQVMASSRMVTLGVINHSERGSRSVEPMEVQYQQSQQFRSASADQPRSMQQHHGFNDNRPNYKQMNSRDAWQSHPHMQYRPQQYGEHTYASQRPSNDQYIVPDRISPYTQDQIGSQNYVNYQIPPHHVNTMEGSAQYANGQLEQPAEIATEERALSETKELPKPRAANQRRKVKQQIRQTPQGQELQQKQNKISVVHGKRAKVDNATIRSMLNNAEQKNMIRNVKINKDSRKVQTNTSNACKRQTPTKARRRSARRAAMMSLPMPTIVEPTNKHDDSFGSIGFGEDSESDSSDSDMSVTQDHDLDESLDTSTYGFNDSLTEPTESHGSWNMPKPLITIDNHVGTSSTDSYNSYDAYLKAKKVSAPPPPAIQHQRVIHAKKQQNFVPTPPPLPTGEALQKQAPRAAADSKFKTLRRPLAAVTNSTSISVQSKPKVNRGRKVSSGLAGEIEGFKKRSLAKVTGEFDSPAVAAKMRSKNRAEKSPGTMLMTALKSRLRVCSSPVGGDTGLDQSWS